MNERRKPAISLRKQPQQARSNELIAVILEAAAQVLAKEGAQRFTTARVAEKAGVSVGSLYQYFPNKAAILFRLQSDEWRQTSQQMCAILGTLEMPPLQRLRWLVRVFVQSECDEAQMRVALDDAAPLYRDAPEARQARSAADGAFAAYLQEVLPSAPQATRAVAGDLIATTLGCVGKRFSESLRSAAEVEAFSAAMGDMFCAYLSSLQG